MRQERRRLLKLMGLGGVAGAASTLAPLSAAAAEDGSLVLSCASLEYRNGRPPSRPSEGATYFLDGEIVDADGEVAGAVTIVRTVAGSRASAGLSFFDQQVFDLAEGRILGTGLATRNVDDIDDFVVSGGTGAFHGAAGSYDMDFSDRSMGGDGSARFTFNLKRST